MLTHFVEIGQRRTEVLLERWVGGWMGGLRKENDEFLFSFIEPLGGRFFPSSSSYLNDSAHTAESSALQGLTAVERISIFEETDVITGHGLDQVLGSVLYR